MTCIATASKMRVAWLSPTGNSWHDILSTTQHDVYQLPEYARIDASRMGGEAVAFHATDGERHFVAPLVLRPIESRVMGGYRDATSPYGFSSPCMSFLPGDSMVERDEFTGRALNAFRDEMARAGIVSCFLRLHPLLTGDRSDYERSGVVVHHGQTVYCDLTMSAEELWSQTRRRDRSYINRSRREGFKLVRDADWSRLDEFVELYYDAMVRVAADENYFFPRSYFTEMRDSMKDVASLLCLESTDGQLAAAGVFTECGGIVQYHLGGTAAAFRKRQPAKLMICEARSWAKRRGNRYLHLGGGVGSSNDSLLYFKSGFSKQRASFSTARIVADEEAYRRLVNEWEAQTQSAADRAAGFFPAYRQPITRQLRVVHPDGTHPAATVSTRSSPKVSSQVAPANTHSAHQERRAG